MTLQSSQSSKLVRFALTGLMATQVAIATAVIHEVVATTPGLGGRQQAKAQGRDKELPEIYKKASPAVVLIETPDGSGSGAIIDANGLIVTNAHVVEGFSRVRVTLRDGRKLMGEVVASGNSNCVDLALVRVANQSKLPTIKLAAANSTEIGMSVVTIGNPLDTTSTLTSGSVSNLKLPLGQVITDVRLNPGNSGGPLLDRQGQLVGVIQGGYRAEHGDGLNVAVSVEQVRALVQGIKQGISPVLGRYVVAATPPSNSPQSSSALATGLVLNGAKSSGTLQRHGNLVCKDKSRANLYTFKGDADQPVMISMTSNQIGSYLVLLGPNGEFVDSQSVDRGDSATILTKLPQAGTYTVVANAQRPEQLGAYQLRVTTPLLAEQGRLTPNSPRLQDGSPYSSYSFMGKANQSIDVALYKFDFDPYLILMDADGKKIAEGKVDRHSTINTKLPRDGAYTLIVSTVKPSDRGQFSFSVQVSEGNTSPKQISQNQ